MNIRKRLLDLTRMNKLMNPIDVTKDMRSFVINGRTNFRHNEHSKIFRVGGASVKFSFNSTFNMGLLSLALSSLFFRWMDPESRRRNKITWSRKNIGLSKKVELRKLWNVLQLPKISELFPKKAKAAKKAKAINKK